MKEIKLSNGKLLCVGYADFQDALDLKDAIFKGLKASDIKIPGMDKLDLAEISKTEIKSDVIELIVKAVLTIDSCKDITNAVNKCFERCTYDKEKITQDIFNDIETRKFYMQIKYEVIKTNMLPFFQNLASLSKKLVGLVKETGSQK